MKKLIVQNLLLGKIPLEKFATMNNIFVFWKQKVFLEKIWLIKRGIKWSQLKKGPLGTINTQLLHLNWFTDFFIFFIFFEVKQMLWIGENWFTSWNIPFTQSDNSNITLLH